ncbi:MAG: ribonuclease R, partial [Candidatus Aminicenantes bacterium]|nr:ribonuclease R [Candidatus Aminicenantes bacterium]
RSVTPEGGGEDIFVPGRSTGDALHGDRVELFVTELGRAGKPEGRVMRVLKKEMARFLGVYKERGGRGYILPFDSASPEEIPVKPAAGLAPREEMIVEADRKTMALTAVLGRADDPGVDTEVVIRRRGLQATFAEATLAEAAAVPGEIGAGDLQGRRDFRDWPTVTIDGEKAQDFDDAVGVRRLENGRVLLGVHIADVAHYVKPGMELDAEAYRRATSVYFPDLTLPMLPEKLSNDLCSLRPRVPRLTMSVLLEIDERGRVVDAKFTPSVIRTVERMTYTSVFKILQGDEEEKRRHASLVPDFLLMQELARRLRTRRREEGGLDFDLVEPELVYREGLLHGVVAAERNEAHMLIEDFMVAANVAVADFLSRRGVPALFRVHPAPAPGDLEKLRAFIAAFGLVLPEAKRIKSRDLQRVLEAVKGKAEEKFISVQVLRAMKLAAYSAENAGHYGLAQTSYSHFTSPIRRYPDLIVHRQLKSVVAGGPSEPRPLEPAARHTSARERAADEAERDLVTWRILRLLKTRLGEEFAGTVVEITKAGLIVELDDYFVDGLLPYQALDGDYYVRKNAKSLRGRRRGRTFDLGDRLRVVLVACDPVLQRMTFMLARASGGPA